jgi:uncharacterized protein involved in exopolysaccharide biosynthesis
MKEDPKELNQECVQEDEINLVDYWRVLLKHKKLIGRIVLVVVVATAVLSLFMTNIFQAKALITPVGSKDTGGGTLSVLAQQLGGLPGLTALPMPGTASLAELVNLLNSNIVRTKMIEKNNLLPVLFHEQWDPEKKEWKKGLSLNPMVLLRKVISVVTPPDTNARKKEGGAPDIQDGLRALGDVVTVRQNIKENTVTITVDYPDPETAAGMAAQLLDALNDHMTGESKRVAKLNKEYLEDQIAKNSDFIIKQKIYNLVAQQIETIMMAEVKENFAFKILDPPIVPDKKIKPNRMQMVILSFLVSLFVGIFVAFFKEYLAKRKMQPSGGSSVS